MLTALSTGLRFRLAVTLAAFAALCFVAPPAVLAFGHGGSTADCMARADKVNHGRPASHDMAPHADHASPAGDRSSTADDHSSPTGDHQMTCCGLFCLSALAADSGVFEPAVPGAAPFPAREFNSVSRDPERLDRPPISSLAV